MGVPVAPRPARMHGKAASWLLAALGIVIWPCLPRRVREAYPWELPLPASTVASINSYIHVIASGILWGVGLIMHMQTFSESLTEAIASPDGSGDIGVITWYGLPGFFAFFFTLRGFLLTVYALDSAARFLAVAISQDALGSVFFAGPLALFDGLVKLVGMGTTRARFGRADEPDRVYPTPDGLVLRANRPHQDWHEGLTFQYGEDLFELSDMREIRLPTAGYHEYRFRPWSNRTVRAIVHLGEPE